MKRPLFAAALCLITAAALAEDAKLGPIEITHPWSRATPKGASVGGGYLTVRNTGTTPDRLVSESSDIARSVEFHETSMENGIARMRPLKNGLEIRPGETVEFKPGSYHVMFTGLKKQLSAGDHIKATLTFEQAGKVDIDYDVLALGASPGAAKSSAGAAKPSMQMPGHDHH